MTNSQQLNPKTKEALMEAIKKLPAPERIILALREYEDLSYLDIGEVLGLREYIVREIHKRVLLKLEIEILTYGT